MRVNPPEEGSVPCAGAFAGPAWPSAPEESVEVWNERIVVNSESSQVLREGHWRHWTSCSVITLKLEMCPASHSTTLTHNSKQTNLPNSFSFKVWKRLTSVAQALCPASLSIFRTQYILPQCTSGSWWKVVTHTISFRFHYRCARYILFCKNSFNTYALHNQGESIIVFDRLRVLNASSWVGISELEIPKLELQQGPW